MADTTEGPTTDRHERLLGLMVLEAQSKLDFAYSIKNLAVDLGFSECGAPPDLHHGTLRLLWFAVGLDSSGKAATARGAFFSWFMEDEWEPHEVISHLRAIQKLIGTTEPPAKPAFDPDLSHLCESPIETAFYDACAVWHAEHDVGFSPTPQYAADPYRLDFAFPDRKIVVELDGHEYHKAQDQRTSDAKRDRALTSRGWTVLRFTGSEIFKDTAGCVECVYDIWSRRGDEGEA